MPYNDPCHCSSVTVGPSAPTTCSGDCIFAPHMLVANDDSVTPCDQTKAILWDDCLCLTGCDTNTVTYEIESFTDNLKDVTIDSNGIVFTSNAADINDLHGEISYIVRCGKLSSRGSLTVVFNDPRYGVVCPDGFVPGYCDGVCVAGTIDLSVTP